ncbi:MAG: D-alanyl-D-alanine dipeptidase [Myxococcota bacterium]|jgi:D-alanyl-D-alanine dipeptidase
MIMLLAVALLAVQPDFVDVTEVHQNIAVEARYFTTRNFVGKRVDGYHANRCLLARPAARALARVQADLEPMGLGLRVYDCYRPQRAVNHFVRWAKDVQDVATRAEYYPNEKKSDLFARGYIAAKSGHSRGATVDLTIVTLEQPRKALDMGTLWDFLDPLSATASRGVSVQARANRALLKSVMERQGFSNYSKEWWHYTLTPEPFPETFFDVPVR